MNLFNKYFLKPPDLQELSKGEAGERWAAFLYQKKGYKVIETNYKAFGKKQLGELDIICAKGGELVAVEVKTRSNENFMRAEESVNYKKQMLLRRMLKIFIQRNTRYSECNLRIDVAVVLINAIDNSINSVRILENVIEDV